MATHYIKIDGTVTLKDLKAKFAAFELLYGKSTMTIRGTVNSLEKGKLMPVFLHDRALVTKITLKYLYAQTRGEGDIILPFSHLTTGFPSFGSADRPEIMFMTVN